MILSALRSGCAVKTKTLGQAIMDFPRLTEYLREKRFTRKLTQITEDTLSALKIQAQLGFSLSDSGEAKNYLRTDPELTRTQLWKDDRLAIGPNQESVIKRII